MPHFLVDLFSLAGRTALVTGGSSGIGLAIAGALSGAGAEVILTARRAERLQTAAAGLRAGAAGVSWLASDLGNRDTIHAFADELLRTHGTPDILVNSAGINLRPPLGELSEADWDQTMAVNLDAPFILGQRILPGMAARRWGRVINLVSQQSTRAFGRSGAYGVSKAALAALTRSQAEAYATSGVCVNSIAPGFVDTPLTAVVFSDPDRAAAMSRRTMVGRNGRVDDLIGAAVFLAGDASAYVTGQTLYVDGGFSAT